jgi:hypothetical protein
MWFRQVKTTDPSLPRNRHGDEFKYWLASDGRFPSLSKVPFLGKIGTMMEKGGRVLELKLKKIPNLSRPR